MVTWLLVVGAAVELTFFGASDNVTCPLSLYTRPTHGDVGVHCPPDELFPDVNTAETSENRIVLGWPGEGPPAIAWRFWMTRNIGESPVRTAELHDVAASSAAAVNVRVMMRMRVIVLPTTPW